MDPKRSILNPQEIIDPSTTKKNKKKSISKKKKDKRNVGDEIPIDEDLLASV
eukprot:CAMPEP_0168619510 /NCGR_PEP_ID=MMETSP0449_2-20121227/6639_1 /TAXON_ID=1082188 /ORGANISM="Strombidium rassoulzadegani, Strain ras09" /LENGTH=51 /DNA_ID=CAMNT_0008660447 /DNA_START=186 /DNA_END=341 /DNA_ORIENTATION=+